jgi:hypothetical protein
MNAFIHSVIRWYLFIRTLLYTDTKCYGISTHCFICFWVYEVFLVDLTCAFVLVLMTVMFMFESEEGGTDSKKHKQFTVRVQEWELRGSLYEAQSRSVMQCYLFISSMLIYVKVYWSYRWWVTCLFSDTLSTAKSYRSLNETVTQPKNRPFGANTARGLKNITAASDNNYI